MSQNEFTLLQEQIKGLSTLMSANFINVNERLDKINGKVGKHDQAITDSLIDRAKLSQRQADHTMEMIDMEKRVTVMEEVEAKHILVCPNSPKIRVLEDNQLSSKAIKKWIVASVSITGIVLGGIWVLIQIYLKSQGV